ncbi:Trx7/PDZ domain-containing (seleno)protein [Blastopirellula marina]|uniref:Peptidase n=1 Tax=Blastopirellula marina TaxID=124 RepID=A0A2S8G1T9_9BACT|nr:Trx7/PDZ domain-containing (seleno)protein [Blastopirellula marina]PQO38406.1 peptidase [Blastopirellula marina]PTL45063.1 PDZ domain-containing protein [Blastopirellula marina]
MISLLRTWTSILFTLLLLAPLVGQEPKKLTREEKVRGDREKVLSSGYWIYNDFQKGLAEAKDTGKPLMVVLRCIPCEECVKLDEEIMESDPVLRPLLDKYVRVRIVGTNGLDLNLFQYDYDQSFAVFLMNADKTIYGRFGTRSHRTDWTSDVSIEGLAKAMDLGLQLHKNYPANREWFTGKQGEKPLYSSPEKFPSLQEKYTATLNYEGDVVKSCIHCHQIGDAQKAVFRDQAQPIPDTYLFPYPHPKAIGMIIDPSDMNTLKEVTPDSVAAKAGLQPGDKIFALNGQIILSIADIQWVLHHCDATDLVDAVVERGDTKKKVTLKLPEGWRQQDDLSWRVSTWPMRRMVLGGLVLEEATDEQRQQAGITDPEKMALRVRFMGRYGDHALAMKTGFKVDDILVSYDGKDNLTRETDLLAYATSNCLPGDKVEIKVVRAGKPITLTLPMQK